MAPGDGSASPRVATRSLRTSFGARPNSASASPGQFDARCPFGIGCAAVRTGSVGSCYSSPIERPYRPYTLLSDSDAEPTPTCLSHLPLPFFS